MALDPIETGALHLEWSEHVGEQIVVVATFEGRWHLPWTVAGADRLCQFVDAIVAGRIADVSALGRTQVNVTLADGTVMTSTHRTLLGRLPLGPLRRWLSVTSLHEPYGWPSE